eukprot:gnl/TRDRNA2_/TRDRNA2_35794_c0_seq1.p1 gnl/TRDRNA2_/TRDRNA2_35794_c0~~gnl/TRDRNA2_/TRDRNA2_35794_c0_seq1.p1  ORF type:complete len:290 (+),score=57.80 gnl/TRDRNA2_/TRDRNA2_35794_c0_seq1:90-959(+)
MQSSQSSTKDVGKAEEQAQGADEDLISGCGLATAMIITYVGVILVIAMVFAWIGWVNIFIFIFDSVESKEDKILQAVIINGILIVVVVCGLPAPGGFFMILNGFFFGFVKGWIINYSALTIAVLTTLAIATCMKERIRRYVMSTQVLREAFLICEEDPSGKFLVLFRFVYIPGFVKNYSVSMLDIHLVKFILTCAPSDIFYGGIYAYFGSKAYKVAHKLRKGDTASVIALFSGYDIAVVIFGIVVVTLLGGLGWWEVEQRKKRVKKDSPNLLEPLVPDSANGRSKDQKV